MRIAQITPRYHPYIGGVEKVVQKISEEMVKKGHEVEVLTADAQQGKSSTSTLNGVSIKRFPSNGLFYYARELYNYLITQGNKYDLVHAHSFHTFLPLLCCRAKEKAGFTLVLTGHYHGKGRTLLTSLLLRAGRNWFGRAYQKADLVFSLTEFEKQLLKQHFCFPENKIKIIPNGVAVEEITCANPLDKAGKILLIVSRLEKYKNIHLAIQAMPYLPDDYQLVIIGDGPYRQQLQRLAANLGLSDRVSFKGQLSNEEVYSWYKTCALVLNLSNLEAFGLTVIEGLAAGKPVLVNNSTALSELARRFEGVTAVEVWKISAPELAGAIIRWVKTPFRAPDLKEYKWDAIVSQLVIYYEILLKKS